MHITVSNPCWNSFFLLLFIGYFNCKCFKWVRTKISVLKLPKVLKIPFLFPFIYNHFIFWLSLKAALLWTCEWVTMGSDRGGNGAATLLQHPTGWIPQCYWQHNLGYTVTTYLIQNVTLRSIWINRDKKGKKTRNVKINVKASLSACT